MTTSFKAQFPLEKRKEVSSKIKSKYPDRVPVIVERAAKSNAPQIDKKKFLVPNDITIGKFIYEIRKHMKLTEEQAIFLFVNEALPPSSSLVSQIYNQHADEDGFLYLQYSGENSFGKATEQM